MLIGSLYFPTAKGLNFQPIPQDRVGELHHIRVHIGLTRAGQGSSQTLAGPLRGHLALHLEMSTIALARSLMHFSPGEHLRD